MGCVVKTGFDLPWYEITPVTAGVGGLSEDARAYAVRRTIYHTRRVQYGLVNGLGSPDKLRSMLEGVEAS